MKKVIFIIAAVAIQGSFFVHLAIAKGNNAKPAEAMEQTILRLLDDPVSDAIKDYYGEPRQYWKGKLLSVKKIQDIFPYYEAVEQVETFTGPHNPPFGIETMTFHIRYGNVEFINFKHQDKSY